MWSLAQLLNPAGHANLVALTIALPAPSLPSDPHARSAASDTRTGESDASAGFRRRIERRGDDSQSAAVIEGSGAMPWTPGLTMTPTGAIAELAVLRGARHAGCTLNPGQLYRIAAAGAAGAALDSWRLQDGASEPPPSPDPRALSRQLICASMCSQTPRRRAPTEPVMNIAHVYVRVCNQ